MQATLAAAPAQATHTSTPTFIGLVRGELFKVSKQRATWFAALVLLAVNFLPYLVLLSVNGQGRESLVNRFGGPQGFLYNMLGTGLSVFRIFVGPFLIIVTARLIGMEYSSGTIRILLSRGVGRLQLLGAKLVAIFAIAAATLVAGLLFHFVMMEILFAARAGSDNIPSYANAQFWTDARTAVLTVAISMIATILMATCVTVIGRSLAVGLSVGLSFFAADNIGLIFFLLASRITNSDFWLNITGLLLGPNINQMPAALITTPAAQRSFEALQGPLVTVDGTHTLVVVLVWCVAFVAVAGYLTWSRDVTE
jgi:ABC-2 type transport system permease protein